MNLPSGSRQERHELYCNVNVIPLHSLRPINKRGGGISIFIKDSIRARHLYRHSLSQDHIETLFVEINTDERTFYIGTIYKPPSADCNVFIDSIQNILSTINQSKIYDLMLCGDFNIDLLNKDCNNSTLYFLNTMSLLRILNQLGSQIILQH